MNVETPATPGEATLRYAEFATPLGPLTVVTDPTAVGDRAGIGPIGDSPDGPVVASGFLPLAQLLGDDVATAAVLAGRDLEAAELLTWRDCVDAYFAGDAEALNQVSVAQAGPEFRLAVWRAMREIPAGQVASYGELAADAGRPAAARAAGSACAQNTCAPFVPCHRVVRSGGDLGNYGYGVDVKADLLAREGYRSGSHEGQSARP